MVVGNRSRLFRCLAVALSLILVLCVAEIVLRVLRAAESREQLEEDPARSGQRALYRRSEDPELIYELIPNAVAKRHGVDVVVNSSGFRDHEFPDSVGGPRIVVLGDSVAWGWGVSMSRAFPQLIEDTLVRSSSNSGEQPVVYNLGVEGYSTRQEIRVLETHGLGFEPDVIVVAYVLNDPDERVGVNHLPADGGIAARFASGPTSEVVEWVRGAWVRLRATGDSSRLPDDYHRQVHARGRERIEAHFRRLGELSRVHDVPVLVAVVPVFDFSAKGAYPWESIHREVMRTAAEQGLEPVDLYEAFRGVPSVPFAHNVWHPNGRGHAVIADALVAKIREVLSLRAEVENSDLR